MHQELCTSLPQDSPLSASVLPCFSWRIEWRLLMSGKNFFSIFAFAIFNGTTELMYLLDLFVFSGLVFCKAVLAWMWREAFFMDWNAYSISRILSICKSLEMKVPLYLMLFSILASNADCYYSNIESSDDITINVLHFENLEASKEKIDDYSPLQRMVLVIDVSSSLHITPPHYISLNIDSNQIRYKLKGFDFR